MSKLLFLILIVTMYASPRLLAQKSTIDSSIMVTLHIDPENAHGAKVSQVFDGVTFIPLETTPESLFGEISHIEIADNCFVIFDNDTHSVLIFDKTGKFRGKVNSSKLTTPADDSKTAINSAVNGFNIINRSGHSNILIFSGNTVYHFDLNAQLIEKKSVKTETLDWGTRFKDGTEIIDGVRRDTNYYDIVLVKNNKDIGRYLPYLKDRYKDDFFSSGASAISDSKIDNELFFTNYFDYNIYKITPKTMFVAYHIVFPEVNSMPPDFRINPIYKQKRRAFFKQNTNIIAGVNNVYKLGDNLFFRVHYPQNSKTKKDVFIYNLKNNSIISLKDIEPDPLSFYLPVTDAGAFRDFANTGFYMCDGENLYTSYSSLAMFTFKDQSADKNPKYNAVMDNYFKTQNKKSNPVIVQLKPKKG